MLNNMSAPTGMLNTYLLEKHVPVEERLTVRTQDGHPIGFPGGATVPKVAAKNKGNQAVKDLDKYMRQTTDPKLLSVARMEQKRMCRLLTFQAVLGLVHKG